jgi:hypothetical protein
MYRLRCLFVLPLFFLYATPLQAQEKKVLILVESGDERNNQDLMAGGGTRVAVDREGKDEVELTKLVKGDAEPPPAGVYFRQVVTFTTGKKSRTSDVMFSEVLPKGTKVMSVTAKGKFQASTASVNGKTLVKPKKNEYVLYEAIVVLPRLK